MKRNRTSAPRHSKPKATAQPEKIDLGRLREMHPRLPIDIAGIMVLRAALGLQRNKHSTGASLQLIIEKIDALGTLIWPTANLATIHQHDSKRITEDGAEAIALAVAHKQKAWCVIRRMQQGEHADWLMEHQHDGVRKLIAFEVSGVDQGSITSCLGAKLKQVANSKDVDQRSAGIVGFQQPQTTLCSVEVKRNVR